MSLATLERARVAPPALETGAESEHGRGGIGRRLLEERWRSLVVVAPLLALVGVVHGVGMRAWPAFVTDDEGTYMAEAWAVATGRGPHHGLAQYTYWYDHPPFGWIQLSWLARLFHAYRPGNEVVATGRSFMLAYTLVGIALVFVIARQLGCTRFFAGLAVALVGLSPISVDYLRLVYLDGIGLPWILGAFAFALSARRSVARSGLAGACFAAGVLSKETFLLLAPAVLLAVWQNAPRRIRRMSVGTFLAVCIAIGLYYPLYALLKGELVPGAGHVSLLGGVAWQLSQRAGSGSIFSSSSVSHQLVTTWVHSDPWLLGLGVGATLPALVVRRLRPIGAAAAIFILTLLRNGYLPEPFVIGFLPFAGIVTAGVGDVLWRAGRPAIGHGARSLSRTRVLRLGALVALLAIASVVAHGALPRWVRADNARMTSYARALQPLVRAETYIDQHISRSATFLVDDVVWTDLVDDGWSPNKVVWAYKLDLDPDVVHRYPGGWRQMDYVVLTQALRADLVAGTSGLGDTVLAIRHGHAVATFGSGAERVVLLKVDRSARQSGPTPPRAGITAIAGAPKQ